MCLRQELESPTPEALVPFKKGPWFLLNQSNSLYHLDDDKLELPPNQ